jgi:hypothetical protein
MSRVGDLEDELITILNRDPHLLVLDGLERELVAYARMDAAHLADDDLDAKTAHTMARRAGLPETAAQSFVGEAKLRQTTDPRAGHFLHRLTQVGASRILITTRLFPYELQDFTGDPVAWCVGALSAGTQRRRRCRALALGWDQRRARHPRATVQELRGPSAAGAGDGRRDRARPPDSRRVTTGKGICRIELISLESLRDLTRTV